MQVGFNCESIDAMLPPALERRFPSRLDDLAAVALEIRRFLEARAVGTHAVYVANLALEELATNTLKYGYADHAVHELLVRVAVDSDRLRLVLEDDGRPFNPLEVPEPDVSASLENRLPGGLGIHLVRKLADRVNYERRDGRNCVTVDIHLGKQPSDQSLIQ